MAITAGELKSLKCSNSVERIFFVGGNLYLADFGFAIMTFSSGFYGYLLATVCFHVISSRLYGSIPLTIN